MSVVLFLPIITNWFNIYDKIKNHYYICKAKNKLKIVKPIIIAITGSNGKTSIKNILVEMLKDYKAYAPPKSYNTPLGIALYINNHLPTDCKYLILEYGARYKNDVKKLCKLYGADLGVVSTICAQHLESFKSINNIYYAKSQLPIYLKDKYCAFYVDNFYTNKMYNTKLGLKVGVSVNNTADIYATDIKIVNYKTYFVLHVNNQEFDTTTCLLGKHNICNIMLATAVCLQLGVDISSILTTIAALGFTPHRLQLIQTRINILDDSYNCSIQSATESLNVLSCLPNKKMICTPGIIEGGNRQFELNSKLGKLMSFADFIIIVGSYNKKAIGTGLHHANYHNKLIYVNNLNEAKHYFNLLKDGDNLLLLNDLPDDYK